MEYGTWFGHGIVAENGRYVDVAGQMRDGEAVIEIKSNTTLPSGKEYQTIALTPDQMEKVIQAFAKLKEQLKL